MWNANDSHISKVEPFLESCRLLYHNVITLGTISKTMILLNTSIKYFSNSVASDPCSFKLVGNLLKPVAVEYWRIQSLYGDRNIWLAQTHLRCSKIWPICCCIRQGKCSKSQESNWKWCFIHDMWYCQSCWHIVTADAFHFYAYFASLKDVWILHMMKNSKKMSSNTNR